MQTVKHAAADAKAKVEDVTAKVEEKMDKGKASATEKTEKAMAHDKAGKMEAKERKHDREAEAEHIKDQKMVDNEHEASENKKDIDGASKGSAVNIADVQSTPDPERESPATNNDLAHEAMGQVAPTVPGGTASGGIA